MTGRLYYWGSETEVLAGDYVLYRPFFGLRAKAGRVIYIPEEDGRELESRGEDSDDWYIELDSGVRYGWVYSPQDLQPDKRLSFVRRGESDFEQTTSDKIEEEESEEASSWTKEEIFLAGIFALFGLVILVFLR